MATEFHVFGDLVKKRYLELSKKREMFVVDVEDLFASYLAAFPEGSNPILRVRTEHDCQTCKQFIRRLGICVTVKTAKWRPSGTGTRVFRSLIGP